MTAVEATVTDEGVAAPETPAVSEPAADPRRPDHGRRTDPRRPATDAAGRRLRRRRDRRAAGGSDTAGSQAAGAAPVDGYDSFTVAQLRGRLRGYALSTVQELVTYEEATRARAPYLTMLRNRLEKLEEQAVESSPLAPRGA